MSKRLDETLGTVGYDNLINGLYPPAEPFSAPQATAPIPRNSAITYASISDSRRNHKGCGENLFGRAPAEKEKRGSRLSFVLDHSFSLTLAPLPTRPRR